MTHGTEPPYDPFGPEGEYTTPQAEAPKRCCECGGISTHALNGWRYCLDCYHEQSTVLMGQMAALVADERAGK